MGVFLLTPESINSKWVMAEAGALWVQDKPISVGYMDVSLKNLPELITRHQHKEITSEADREEFVQEIVELCNDI